MLVEVLLACSHCRHALRHKLPTSDPKKASYNTRRALSFLPLIFTVVKNVFHIQVPYCTLLLWFLLLLFWLLIYCSTQPLPCHQTQDLWLTPLYNGKFILMELPVLGQQEARASKGTCNQGYVLEFHLSGVPWWYKRTERHKLSSDLSINTHTHAEDMSIPLLFYKHTIAFPYSGLWLDNCIFCTFHSY